MAFHPLFKASVLGYVSKFLEEADRQYAADSSRVVLRIIVFERS